jgi:phosphatidate phosphatase APP1
MTSLLDVMTRRPRPLTNLADEDRVVLFPSVGHLDATGQHWIIDVHGDVSAAAKKPSLGKRMLLRLLQRSMRATREDFSSDLFQRRMARFLALDRPGRRIAVEVADRVHVLPKKSHRNGHFHALLQIPAGDVRDAAAAASGAAALLPLGIRSPGASLATSGSAHLLGRTGLSIISDIDDTLKHTHVACKRTLLVNTFLRPFQTIPGMADLFCRWNAAGAAFHYVSSSPWQLYEHLAAHLADEGFPTGSFHLRHFRLRDHLLRRLLMLRRTGKTGVIRTLFKTFPSRRFLLIGDSGEHDPEIYGSVARRHPRQVAGIFIRQLDGPTNTRRRYLRAFRYLDPSLITLFRDAAELTRLPLPSV